MGQRSNLDITFDLKITLRKSESTVWREGFHVHVLVRWREKQICYNDPSQTVALLMEKAMPTQQAYRITLPWGHNETLCGASSGNFSS